ncbi:MAG: aminotransferase class I/II-fold pyridoxal phosphate-dependent enzyme [Cytophagales bacterium]|nr:aminotransferase class I/II-fold pyridoxal phosphate-dependent enzyme [Cytophagales bacterium]
MKYSSRCVDWFSSRFGDQEFLLTPSCSQAMRWSMELFPRPQRGGPEEALVPSFTHPAIANALLWRGWKLRFIDIEPQTCNLDMDKVAEALSVRTGWIICMHYGGFACDLDKLKKLLSSSKIRWAEDNAHGLWARHGNTLLGGHGDLSWFSFEKQKNIQCGEGGGVLISKRLSIPGLREKYHSGTNRQAYLSGEVSEYNWQTLGGKYDLPELSCAYLLGQLEEVEKITERRLRLWKQYHELLQPLREKEGIRLPLPRSYQQHNGHIYFIILRSAFQRKQLQNRLARQGIETHSHYVPLHQSPMGKAFPFHGLDKYSSNYATRLLRLPIHADMREQDINRVVESVYQLLSPKVYRGESDLEKEKLGESLRETH